MSCQKELKKLYLERNNCKYNTDNVILYIDDKFNKDMEKVMKKGYQEMAFINLQLASMTERELVDIDDYEAWLCGEW